MRRAIEIAEKGRGRVHPNPLVGCVLVRDGEVIAEGWHDHIGGLHAEQAAIADAEERGISTIGSTAYVTLEPCNHHGRTPPCTEALLWAGVERVVIGSLDPNPTVRGGGMSTLMEGGIDVENGVLEKDCSNQMIEFIHWCEKRRPLVLLKAAVDCKGRVDNDGSSPSERFTSNASINRSHKTRSENMAILVGVNTVLRDNPELTARGVGAKIQPTRVVIDPSGKTPENSKLMEIGSSRVILIHSKEIMRDSPQHVDRYVIPTIGDEIEVERLLDLLGDLKIQSLIVEGGPKTWKRFLDSGTVDRALLIESPIDIGSGETDVFGKGSLIDAGLVELSKEESEGDSITHWARSH